MVDRALSDFSEAVLGHNSDMKWSLSPEIMTRSVMPVFNRCAQGKLSADQALEVAMDFVATRMQNNIKTCRSLFTVLDTRLEELLHGEILPAQDELKELFLGFNGELNWAVSPESMKEDMRPTFERVASGHLSANQAVVIFVDGVVARNETMLAIINRLVVKLAQELRRVLLAEAQQPKAVNGNGNAE